MSDRNNRNSKTRIKSTRKSDRNTSRQNRNISSRNISEVGRKTSSDKKTVSFRGAENKRSSNIYYLEKERAKYDSLNRRELKKTSVRAGRISDVKPNVLNKRNRKRTIFYANIFSLIIFIIILYYFGVFFAKFFNKTTVNYDYVSMGTIDSPKSATGIIIRNEKVYTSPQDGVLDFNVFNNEKVKVGTDVATIKSLEVLVQLEEELQAINKEITTLQEARAELSWFSQDVENINSQIQNVIDENIYQLAQNDISKLYEISSSISSNIDIRNQIVLSETTGSLSELASKRKAQEDKISQNSSTITTSESGIISYYLDGLEDTLTFENMANLTKEQTKMDTSLQTINLQVAQGEPIFKIIDTNDWYIASYIKSEFVEGWEQGDIYTIYVKNNFETKEIEAQVYLIDKGPKEAFMILKITKNMLDYIDNRSITFEVDKVTTGFKINNNSIAEANLLKIPMDFITDEKTIIKQSDTSKVNLIVDVFYETDDLEYAYIPIKLGVINIGDTILNPENESETYIISEILTTKGVYVINTGITKYVKINLQNSVSNDKYTILDPTLNTNLTIYDNIILDVQNIQNEQSIY